MLPLLLKIKYLVLVILVKNTDYNTKINEMEKKIADHSHEKYITTEVNKFTAEIVDLRLKGTNLACKSDIANNVKRHIFIIN